jgi:hypothetical protein
MRANVDHARAGLYEPPKRRFSAAQGVSRRIKVAAGVTGTRGEESDLDRSHFRDDDRRTKDANHGSAT